MLEKKYKLGYCNLITYGYSAEDFALLKKCSEACEELIFGVPSDYAMTRLYGEGRNGYNAGTVKAFWEDIKFIKQVIVLDENDYNYQAMYEKLHFDVCFYGTEYGQAFETDKAFFKERNVAFVPLMSLAYTTSGTMDSIVLRLKSVHWAQKVVLFGTGKYFDLYIKSYAKYHEIAYAVDNSSEKWRTLKNGIPIKSPEELKKEDFSNVLIVICSKNYSEILLQLKQLGDFDYRTLLFNNNISLLEEFPFYKPVDKKQEILEQVHKINYDLLEEFDRICRKHDIDYFLNFGSLLGALRHKAIIPWDNDIDIVMKREDWDKLKQHKNEFSSDYFWLGNDILGNKKHYDCLDRIGYKNAYIRMDEDVCNYYENYFNSIHLDLFLIDKTYDNFKGKFQRFELALLYGLMNARRHKSMFFDYTKKMRFMNKIVCFLGKFFSLVWLKKQADRIARRFDKDDAAPYYFISNDVLQKLKMLFPAEIFKKSVDVPFGKLTAKIAYGGDAMCRILFGNYMELPPVEQRVPHCGRVLFTEDSYVFEEPIRGSVDTK